jgi:Flp pilus assembly protein TadG
MVLTCIERGKDRLRRLVRDRQGSTAVEFGVVGTALVFLILGAMQVGLYLYTSAAMEAAVTKAMRQVMTGTASAGAMTAAQFRSNILCPLLPGGLSCSNVITNLVIVSQGTNPNGFYQFVNAAQSWIVPPTMDNTQTSFCTGTAGSVVYAQVYYAMPVVLPFVFANKTAQWQGRSAFFVGAFAAFRNEPFQSNSQGAC